MTRPASAAVAVASGAPPFLVDACGIEVAGHPVADFFSLSMDQVRQLAFHNPDAFRIDPATLPPAAQTVSAGNRAALAVYSGTSMSDPTLIQRLSTMKIPTLVLWGQSDQIADHEYGRAFAAAIPMAHFQLLSATGHMPQIETPDKLLEAIWDWEQTHFSSPAAADHLQAGRSTLRSS